MYMILNDKSQLYTGISRWAEPHTTALVMIFPSIPDAQDVIDLMLPEGDYEIKELIWA